ncbi:tetratricopeptide repeat protein [Montanilutibacter psychrotolerans]|uniref:Tetratricopeptide repeat protein n=1 Tax=Montanilutibacter psychrotolerans TaxID=1327343 RepID=A0A3M8STT9_9GAMM|nr:tetratricopeptide repeat protein [Lysobacter psychrotolerans]RNF84115.1 tetratricopeptide repeat protein [Lysobacter psychrotolerans]
MSPKPALLRPLAVVVLSLLLGVPVVSAAAAVPAARSGQAGNDPVTGSLEPLLAGEFALQAGRLEEAARWYLQAARAADDMVLAERATRIALLAKHDGLAADALALWRRQGGTGNSLLAADAALSLRRNDESGARRKLSALLASPGDDGWRQALGVVSSGSRDSQQAARLVEYLVEGDRMPPVLLAWIAFGGLAQRLEQPALAERIVNEVVRRFPGEPRVALLRASQLREAGKPDEARAALAAISDQAESNAMLRLSIADEYDELGDLARAEQVLARGPQDDQTYALRASLLARAEDNAGLASLYEALARDGARPDPRRRLLLGQIAEFLKRFDEALEWYRGVPGGPQKQSARLRAANVLHELKRGDEAFAALRELQADAAVPDEARQGAYLLEGELHQRDNDDAGELDAYARALAAFPDDAGALYARALYWERHDDIPRAEADFRKILVSDPDSVSVLNALGYTLADRTTRYQEALELIDRARTAEPDNAAIIDSYGWVLYRLGRHEEALVELRRAFALRKDPEIGAHLGELLWVLGKQDEARKYFDEALKLDPENRSLKRAMEKVGA